MFTYSPILASLDFPLGLIAVIVGVPLLLASLGLRRWLADRKIRRSKRTRSVVLTRKNNLKSLY